MKKLSLVIIGLVSLITVSVVFAAESIRYDFDEIEVPYAAEFTARPVDVSPDSWIAKLAGGTDKPVQIIYGAFYLKNNGQVSVKDEFIKVTGENGSERFLANSMRTLDSVSIKRETQNPDGSTLTEEGTIATDIGTFFWSAKKLQDTQVVKDFTPPIISISLYRHGSPEQGVGDYIFSAINLSFADDGQAASQAFWDDEQKENLYKADLTTLNDAGKRY